MPHRLRLNVLCDLCSVAHWQQVLLLVATGTVITMSAPVSAVIIGAENDAMNAVRDALGVGGAPPSWTGNDAGPKCTSWVGVTCNSMNDQRVIELDLSAGSTPWTGGKGTISLAVVNLDHLQKLVLKNNAGITGLPNRPGTLTMLDVRAMRAPGCCPVVALLST